MMETMARCSGESWRRAGGEGRGGGEEGRSRGLKSMSCSKLEPPSQGYAVRPCDSHLEVRIGSDSGSGPRSTEELGPGRLGPSVWGLLAALCPAVVEVAMQMLPMREGGVVVVCVDLAHGTESVRYWGPHQGPRKNGASGEGSGAGDCCAGILHSTQRKVGHAVKGQVGDLVYSSRA